MNRTSIIAAIIAAALLCACTTALPAQPRASYPATMYVTYDGAPLYDSAHHMSAVLEELPLGDSILVLGTAGKFYRVQRGERQGFLYWANIAAEKPKGKGRRKSPARKKTGTTATPEPAGEKQGQPAGTGQGSPDDTIADSTAAVSSGTGKDRKPRARESQGARCRGITRSGGQCSRIATDPSGYCWQHRK